MVGTYLAEYGQRSLLANAVRFVSDVLLSAPSILIGLFIYQLASSRSAASPASPAAWHSRSS